MTFSIDVTYDQLLDDISKKLYAYMNTNHMKAHILSDHVFPGERVPIDDDHEINAFWLIAGRNPQEVLSLYMSNDDKEISELTDHISRTEKVPILSNINQISQITHTLVEEVGFDLNIVHDNGVLLQSMKNEVRDYLEAGEYNIEVAIT